MHGLENEYRFWSNECWTKTIYKNYKSLNNVPELDSSFEEDGEKDEYDAHVKANFDTMDGQYMYHNLSKVRLI